MRLTAPLLCLALLASCSRDKVVGDYALDRAALAKRYEGIPAMKPAVDLMDIHGRLNADGTCTMTMTLAPPGATDGGKLDLSGTYELEGVKITFTVLQQNGKPVEKPDTKTGTLENGVLAFNMNGMDVTLKRK